MRYLLATFLFLFIANASINASAESIKFPSHSAVLGNPKGKIQVIEFYDYRCGYCKKMVSVIQKITTKHKDVQYVLIEYPIFGGGSVDMAKMAMAVNSLDPSKEFEIHQALMAHKGKFTGDSIRKISEEIGLKFATVSKEMTKSKYDKYIEDNTKFAKDRGVRGTPHLVINGNDVRGAISYDSLDEYITELENK